ncbi:MULTISPECIES: PH domain-containing protein [Cytobacillus]|uniref:PH domain-containing protein n=1 Tax=Cytobacillus TaxID=2675230 RepID=UPI002041F09B|nr:PH domain-containing protein [Cytobacillus firmus]MCM3706401.1 PH domain-containing protein [Cytobacillus firmus]
MNSVINSVEHVLLEEENIIECLTCSLISHYYLAPQLGLLAATNKRLLFYRLSASESTKELVEEFAYIDITSIKEKKGITGKHIHLYSNDKFQQIQGMNMFDFMAAVKEKMSTVNDPVKERHPEGLAPYR